MTDTAYRVRLALDELDRLLMQLNQLAGDVDAIKSQVQRTKVAVKGIRH
jgi:hypothetical protein